MKMISLIPILALFLVSLSGVFLFIDLALYLRVPPGPKLKAGKWGVIIPGSGIYLYLKHRRK